MTNELCFCFWYYLSGQRNLVGLSARGYYLSGDDDQKGQLLSRLASSDHRTQNISHVPPRLLRLFPDGVPYETVMEFGIEEVFAELIVNIAGRMPPGLPVPEEKLFYAQPMFDFGHGYIPCEIGDGFVRGRDD